MKHFQLNNQNLIIRIVLYYYKTHTWNKKLIQLVDFMDFVLNFQGE